MINWLVLLNATKIHDEWTRRFINGHECKCISLDFAVENRQMVLFLLPKTQQQHEIYMIWTKFHFQKFSFKKMCCSYEYQDD